MTLASLFRPVPAPAAVPGGRHAAPEEAAGLTEVARLVGDEPGEDGFDGDRDLLDELGFGYAD